MPNIVSRDGAHGVEWMFRHNGNLYVFKSKKEAEVEYQRLVNGSLF